MLNVQLGVALGAHTIHQMNRALLEYSYFLEQYDLHLVLCRHGNSDERSAACSE